MKKSTPFPPCWLSVAVAAVLLGAVPAAVAQDSVTVPKSRLEELERKERELERLRGDLNEAHGELKQAQTNLNQAQRQNDLLKKEAAVAPQAAPTPPAHTAPPLASLPPLGAGDVVNALDLAAHYKADPAAADGRYRKKEFVVRGEIAGFQKPMFQQRYEVMLKTAEPDVKVICSVYPPEKYKAVIITHTGDQAEGVIGDTRFPLAKVGSTVELKGECRGLKDGAVRMGGCQLGVAK